MPTTTTTTTPVTPATAHPRRRMAARISLWTVRMVLAAQFAASGALKLAAEPAMVSMFADIGAGQGLRLVVGALELAGAIGVLIPRTQRAAALGLVLLMAAAALTNVAVLQMTPALPLMLGVVASVVTIVRLPRAGAR